MPRNEDGTADADHNQHREEQQDQPLDKRLFQLEDETRQDSAFGLTHDFLLSMPEYVVFGVPVEPS